MKKKKISLIVTSIVLLLGLIIGVSISVSAASTVTEADWIATPEKSLKKCEGGSCDHSACDYAYSFAIVGDTQNLNIYDVNNKTSYMNGLYEWILDKKDDYNIQYVMGLGDITQAYYRGYQSGIWEDEWVNAKEAISLLDGKLPYSLVRGNHDITEGLNTHFGEGTAYYTALKALAETTDSLGRPMAGFLDETKIEDTYRKIEIYGNKYIIFTLDWHPTEECLVWLDGILEENSDYQAIVTLHSFLTRNSTITDDYEDTFPYENLTGSRPNWEEVSASGGNVFPKVLWQSVLSKHENVELILSGHIDEDDILKTQLRGDNGNTVTAMLINAQTIDSTIEPVGMVAMFYVSADGKVINAEYVSTVRDNAGKNAYLRDHNQFDISLDYTVSDTDDGWTETRHGDIVTEVYNAYPFHVLMDDDSDESTSAFHFGSYNSWQDTLKAIHDYAGNTNPSSHKKMRTFYIVLAEDHTDAYSGNHDNRAAYNFGKTVLDLNGHTLTVTSNGTNANTFLPFYVTSAGKYPRFGIENGNIVIRDNVNLIVTQSGASAAGETGTLELTDLNVTYDVESAAAAKPFVSFYNGGGTGSYVDLTVTNCNIDTSSVGGALTVFNLKDTNNNNHVDLNLVGGSINGSTVANTTLFTVNELFDKITFSKDNDGNYTEVSLLDSGAIDGVYYSDDADTFLEFGTPIENGGKYEYSLNTSDSILTEYGEITPEYADKDAHPFLLFKDGKVIFSFTDWGVFINNHAKTNATYQSGCTVLLRKDVKTATANDHLTRISDITIDLGGHTLSRGKHLFNAMGTNAATGITKITVKNGTLSAANDYLITFNDWASSSGVHSFEFVFDGINIDVSAGHGIATCYKDGINGSESNVILNDCKIIRGSSTSTKPLFNLADPVNADGVDKNLDNVHVYINGGTLTANSTTGLKIATYDPELIAGAGSPDTVTLGEGKDGKPFTVVLPTGATAPSTTYPLTDGTYCLAKDSDDGKNAYLTFNSLSTVFGDVAVKYVSTEAYPFALFVKNADGSYTFKMAYASFKDAVAGVRTYAPNIGDSALIAMRRDYESTGTESSTIKDIKAKIVVDLQGYTLSSTSTKHFIDINFVYTDNADMAPYASEIEFRNGSIANNRTGTNKPLVALGHREIGETVKKFGFIFENISFSTKSNPIILGWNHTGTTGLDIDVILNGCTFDFSGAAAGSTMFHFAADYPYVTVDMSFTGCEVIASKLDDYKLYTKGDEDTAIFSADEDGVYLTVTQTSNSLPTTVFTTADGASVSYNLASSEGGKYVYTLAKGIVTEYGTIPADLADSSLYPVILFGNGTVTGYATIAEAFGKLSGTNTYVILLRDSITKSTKKGVAAFKGELTIDLGGNTLTVDKDGNYLLDMTVTGNGGSATYNFKNGKIVKTGGNGLVLYNYNASLTANANYTFNFDNVTFASTVKGDTIFKTWENGSASETVINNNLQINAKSTFTDCVFDMAGSHKDAIMLPLYVSATGEASGIDRVVHDVTINGGSILADLKTDITDNFVKLDGNTNGRADSITFGKADGGNYTSVTIPSGIDLSDVTANGGEVTLVKIGDGDGNDVYRYRSTALKNIDFVPKMSFTLESDLIMNVYVPVSDILLGFELDGKKYTDFGDLESITLDGEKFYRIQIPLSANKAARNVILKATVAVGDDTATATFTLSLINYAKTVIGEGSAEEKQLVLDILSYIRAAYDYFGTNDSDAIAKIDALLGTDYDKNNAPVFNGSADEPTSELVGVTFSLEATPTIKFYLPEGANAKFYAFYSEGRKLEFTTGTDEIGDYIEISVYAYAMGKTITYTVGGNEAGSYHINSYYTYVTTSAELKDDAKLIKLVERFAKYCESAESYRLSVIG